MRAVYMTPAAIQAAIRALEERDTSQPVVAEALRALRLEARRPF